MLDPTQNESLQALLTPVRTKGVEGDLRINLLVARVLDPLLEVEALRKVSFGSKLGVGGKGSAYGRAYEKTAYLTQLAGELNLAPAHEQLYDFP